MWVLLVDICWSVCVDWVFEEGLGEVWIVVIVILFCGGFIMECVGVVVMIVFILLSFLSLLFFFLLK